MRLLIVLVFFSLNACVGNKAPMTYLSGYTTEHYQSYGDLNLMGSDIQQHLQVNGHLHAQNSKIHQLTINGDAMVHNCLLAGPGSVNGKLQLENVIAKDNLLVRGDLYTHNSNLKGVLITYGHKTVLKNSTVTKILVKANIPNPIVELQQGASVNGPIQFEFNKGRVFIDKTSAVKGQIMGAEVANEVLVVDLGKK